MAPRLQHYLDSNRERMLKDLCDWLSIPSISADPDRAADVRRSAEFCARLLVDAGLENVEIIDTDGAPAVYGDWLHAGEGSLTALVYGHHDVQPVDPLSQWTSPPFEPVIVDGELRGRGAVDDKGQTFYEIEAVRGLLKESGTLPVNVKFLIEGEEEVGSPNFEKLLTDRSSQLASDVIVVSDTTMWAPDVPSVCMGMRGLVAFDIVVRTARADLHSGSFGGSVPNAAKAVAHIADALHDGDGRVTIPGFYDRVRELTDFESESIRLLPFSDQDWMEKAGVRALAGEAGRTTLERIWTRPTAEVVGLSAGYTGTGIKTIVPAEANLKIAFRLVADQDPGEIGPQLRAWLDSVAPDGVELTVTPEGAVAPALTDENHPAVRALSRAIATVWGQEPLFTREGGSGPEEALGRVLQAPVLYLGVGLPDDRFHAPNERLVLDQLWRGLLAAGELWNELSEIQPSADGR